MPRCKKGNTFPDEGWHDGDDELVNRGLVQEGPDDLASAHHPDVLASLRAEAFGKGTDRLGDEVDARGHGSRRPPPREHIVHGICTEACAHLQTPVEGLAAEDLGIGGALEFRETVEALWSWPFRQPIEIAIGSSHVAVRARRNIDDDFSLWHDTPMSVSSSSHGHAAQDAIRKASHPGQTLRNTHTTLNDRKEPGRRVEQPRALDQMMRSSHPASQEASVIIDAKCNSAGLTVQRL